jgi:Ca2+-binding EF-hand superfamily protein
MECNNFPLDTLFTEFDTNHTGGLAFEDFICLNEFVGIDLGKSELRKVFDLIDRQKIGQIRIDEVRAILSIKNEKEIDHIDCDVDAICIDSLPSKEENLTGNEILVRQ